MGTVIPVLSAPLILRPRAPYDIAQEFVRRNYNLGQVQTLHHHNGAFYAWTGTHYPEKDGSTLRAELYAFLNDAVRSAKVPFNPTCARVNEVLDCLKAVVHLDLSHSAPTWLCDAPFPANEILSCKNGL